MPHFSNPKNKPDFFARDGPNLNSKNTNELQCQSGTVIFNDNEKISPGPGLTCFYVFQDSKNHLFRQQQFRQREKALKNC